MTSGSFGMCPKYKNVICVCVCVYLFIDIYVCVYIYVCVFLYKFSCIYNKYMDITKDLCTPSTEFHRP